MLTRWTLFSIFLFASGLYAAEDNELTLKQMLLTPGDLVNAHSDLDNKCNQCHEHFEKANQTPLCLDCHEQIADELEAKTGFHSHLKSEQTDNCNSCHSDHLGRDADIVGLDRDQFDHNLTDFKLEGEHQGVACESCHKLSKKDDLENKAFRIKKTECIDCHVDVHDGEQGEQCTDCHNEKSWQENKFDHQKTDFPLQGEHKQLSCESCHQKLNFEKGRTECVSCHLGKDKHQGLFGKECKNCHQEKSWDETKFDHYRDADFRLKGKHKNLTCEGCHREGLPLGLPTACIDCHQADDRHQNSNGEDCAQCHSEKGWNKTEFNHNKDTDFRLNGAHKKVTCKGCHIAQAAKTSKQNLEHSTVVGTQCKDCHSTIDPHLGKMGDDCGSCHNEQNWSKEIVFSHDFSEFPLTGAHQNLLCESCHQDKQFLETPGNCEACHLGDDIHNGSLGEVCSDCHNTSLWLSWNFDHDEKTRFALEGAHRDLSCELCHSPQQSDPLKPAMRCVACHQQDDIHRGDFGPDCQQCHGTEVFDDVR